MRYRKLGGTGLEVSEIGFGSWGIGGLSEGATSYGATDDNESKLALNLAFEKGITFYDTSNIYGYGHSEELLGEVFKSKRDKVVIASKVGFVKHGGPHNLEREYVRECLEGTLKRLATDHVDLYQIHSPPIEMLTEEVVETFEGLKKEGKIRAYGFSVKNPQDGFTAIKFGFKAVQVNFSMIDQRAIETGLFEAAKNGNVGIISRTPLCFGFLTGAIKDLKFDPSDHRANWSEGQLKRWADAPDLFSYLNQGKERTPVQLALKYCLSFDAVSTVIPGMLNRKEVEEDSAASDMDLLSAEELKAVEEIYKSNTFFERAVKKE